MERSPPRRREELLGYMNMEGARGRACMWRAWGPFAPPSRLLGVRLCACTWTSKTNLLSTLNLGTSPRPPWLLRARWHRRPVPCPRP
eukprot:351478-Chlamydomonas_euryale.AAC.1